MGYIASRKFDSQERINFIIIMTIVLRVWKQSYKDSNNEASIKLPPVGVIEPNREPQLACKAVFWASEFERSLARWLVACEQALQ